MKENERLRIILISAIICIFCGAMLGALNVPESKHSFTYLGMGAGGLAYVAFRRHDRETMAACIAICLISLVGVARWLF